MARAGRRAVFSVRVNGTQPSYEWAKNDQVIEGAEKRSFRTERLTPADDHTRFRVTVTVGERTELSREALLTVAVRPLRIIRQPEGVTVKVGRNAVLRVRATGHNPLTYRWLLNGIDIEGATRPTLKLRNVALTDSGATVQAQITDRYGNTILSESVGITVAQ